MISSNSKSDEIDSLTNRTFLQALACSIALGLILVSAFILVIDPEGRFELASMAGLNQTKSTEDPRSRVAKSRYLASCDYRYVMIGTSRTDIGLNPGYAGFTAGQAYNAGLQNSNMLEIQSVAQYTSVNQPSAELFIGLDFLSFLDEHDFTFDYPYSRFANSLDYLATIKYLFSRKSLIDSVKTIRDNKTGDLGECSHNGMEDRRQIPIKHRDAFDVILGRFVRRYSASKYSKDRVDALGETFLFLASNNTKVHVFISPMHALQIILLNELGILDNFLQWKRDLAEMLATVNNSIGDQDSRIIWDFSGFNSITTEAIPDNPDVQMRWIRESSHYRAVTGDLVLDRLLDQKYAANDIPEDFGVILSAETIAAITANTLSGIETYSNKNPQEIERLKKIIASQDSADVSSANDIID